MQVTRYDIRDLPERLVQRWGELLSLSPVRSAFLSYPFCRAVEEVRGGVVVLHIAGESGQEAFLPLQMRKGRSLLGHAQKTGGDMSDFFGVVGALSEKLGGEMLLDAGNLSSLRFDHAVPALCPFDFAEREVREGIRLRTISFEQFRDDLLGSNKRFLQSVLSRERKLVREVGPLSFAWKSENALADVEHLVAAKRAQYRRTSVGDSLRAAWRRDLLRRLLTIQQTRHCQAIFSTLHAGGKWVASKLSLICEDTLHSWFSVYSPEFGAYGPGHLLWFRTIEAGCSQGIRTFDFGEGGAPYKAAYRGESYELWKGILRKRNLLGHAERALQALQWRLAKLAGAGNANS